MDPLSAALVAANLVLIGAGIGKSGKSDDDNEDQDDDDGDDNAVSMAT